MDPVLQMFSVFHPCHLVSPYHFCAHHPNLQQPSSFSRTCPQLEPLLPHIDWKCSEQWAWGCHTQGPFLITKIISQSFPSEQATVAHRSSRLSSPDPGPSSLPLSLASHISLAYSSASALHLLQGGTNFTTVEWLPPPKRQAGYKGDLQMGHQVWFGLVLILK